MAVCGNTAMQHLLLGLPVRQLGRAPFVAAVRDADIKAREFDLRLPRRLRARGAEYRRFRRQRSRDRTDRDARALARRRPPPGHGYRHQYRDFPDPPRRDHLGLLPVRPGARGRAYFLRHAGGGRCDRTRHSRRRPHHDRRDRQPPAGRPVRLGRDRRDGGLAASRHPRRRRPHRGHASGHRGDRRPARRRAGAGVTFTQHDVRAVQLAKAAIRTGVELLLRDRSLAEGDIERVVIAGAFGAYIDVKSAIAIGLLPALPLDRFKQVGNAAGVGVRRMLASRKARAQARELARAAAMSSSVRAAISRKLSAQHRLQTTESTVTNLPGFGIAMIGDRINPGFKSTKLMLDTKISPACRRSRSNRSRPAPASLDVTIGPREATDPAFLARSCAPSRTR